MFAIATVLPVLKYENAIILIIQFKSFAKFFKVLYYGSIREFHSPSFLLPFPVPDHRGSIPFLTRYCLGCPEATDPMIHMLFKFIGRSKSINAHGAKKMADAFAGHIFRHGHISRKRRHPGSIIGAA